MGYIKVEIDAAGRSEMTPSLMGSFPSSIPCVVDDCLSPKSPPLRLFVSKERFYVCSDGSRTPELVAIKTENRTF